jgi:hypothetical protein
MMRRRLKDWDSLKAAAAMHEPDPVLNAKMQLVDAICAKLEDVNTFKSIGLPNGSSESTCTAYRLMDAFSRIVV